MTVDCTGGSGAGTPMAGLQAAVLCGGLGTRLRPLTDAVPKPMVDVNGVPFLEHLLRQLVSQGVGRIVLMTGYLGDQIRAHFGSGQDHRCDIVYSHGSETWSTTTAVWARSGAPASSMPSTCVQTGTRESL